jgi:SAM-dependent methyltransferase
MDSHAQREKDFHNKIHADESRTALNRFYSITASSTDAYRRAALEDCKGKSVLELGCGRVAFATELADAGANVIAMDISEVAVRRTHDETGRDDIRFAVMDAEHLGCADGVFDLVVGRSVIHHLVLERAFEEICRVLKPDGRAVFLEPLGHNPILNAYRRATPALHSVDEHPLKTSDLDLTRRYFRDVEVSYFHLTSLAAIAVSRTRLFSGAVRVLERADAALVRTPLSRFAWIAVIVASHPVAVS